MKMGERKLSGEEDQNKAVEPLIDSEQVHICAKKCNLLNKKESEFVFAEGYSEERTDEEIEEDNLKHDETDQSQIDESELNDTELDDHFECDWSMHQDNENDMNSSDEEK